MVGLDPEGSGCYDPSAYAPVSRSRTIEVSEAVLVGDSHFPRTKERGAAHCARCGITPPFRRSSGLLGRCPDHNGVAAFCISEIRSGWVLPVLRGLGVRAWDGSGSHATTGAWRSCFMTQHRRKSHRFRRLSLTKPHRKFTRVHPSDLPFARFTWMVQVPLGLRPSALACFVT